MVQMKWYWVAMHRWEEAAKGSIEENRRLASSAISAISNYVTSVMLETRQKEQDYQCIPFEGNKKFILKFISLKEILQCATNS